MEADLFSIAFTVCRTLALLAATVLCYDLFQCYLVYRRVHKRQQESTPKQRATERTFAARAMTWQHALLFMLQKWNYWVHLWSATWYCLVGVYVWGKPTTERSVCEFLLSSPGIASHFKVRKCQKGPEEEDEVNPQADQMEGQRPQRDHTERQRSQPDQLEVVFERRAFPFVFTDKHLCDLLIVMRLPAVPAPASEPVGTGCKIVKFVFNGEDVPTKNQLAIVTQLFSSVCHGEIHSYFGQVYEERDNPKLQEYSDIFLHGQYLNEASADYPSFCYGIPRDYYRHVLEVGGTQPMRKHLDLMHLTPYSPVYAFLWRARQVVFRCIREHKVDLNPELFFLTSVLHSIDHYSSASVVMYRYQESPNGSSAWLNFNAAFFYYPSQELFPNKLKNKAHKNKFYEDMYRQLSDIDQHLADQVTLSISY